MYTAHVQYHSALSWKLRHIVLLHVQLSLSKVHTAFDVWGGVCIGDDKDLCSGKWDKGERVKGEGSEEGK